MRKILDDINQAYRFVSTILVSADATEAVAAARVRLRNAMASCEEKIRVEDEMNAKKEEQEVSEEPPIKED